MEGNVAEIVEGNVEKALMDNQCNSKASGQDDDYNKLSSVDQLVDAYKAIVEADCCQQITVKTLPRLSQFLSQALEIKEDYSKPRPNPIQLDPVQGKDVRRKVHQLFKNISWLPCLSTETVMKDDQNVIELRIDSVSGRKRKRDSRSDWGGGKNQYVKFALQKQNIDTHNALSMISKMLRINQKVFSVAGTKDKRAITVQWATAFKVLPEKLNTINSKARDIRIGNFSYVQDQVRLGDLQGNKFVIVLRNVKGADQDQIQTAVNAVRSQGFINYYGLQRFGSSDSPTHWVGAALLRGNWDEAIIHIMAPAPNTREDISSALTKFLEGGDPADTLASLPTHLIAERIILNTLAQQGRNALVNALLAIPRNLRTMYIHAYQSYLWNCAASERVARYGGSAVVVGDLVISRQSMHAFRKSKMEGSDHHSSAELHEVSALAPVHVVTEEEAKNKTYSIEDVVLPLPGSRILFPDNDIAHVYHQIAQKDGLSLTVDCHKVKEFSQSSLPGTYRHLIYKPHDLEYHATKYDDDKHNEDLELNFANSNAAGRFLALKLSFTLPSSTYATMLIRELTKMPTTVEYARSLADVK
jgi:tRNA pseudouridine13 synthase